MTRLLQCDAMPTMPTVRCYAMPTMNRYLGTPVLTSLINIFYNGNIKDCNSGMRIFRNDKIKQIKLCQTNILDIFSQTEHFELRS